jgi:hypothetical protein
MEAFSAAAYGPVFAELLTTDRCRALGRGHADSALRSALERATVSTAFAHARVADPNMARCCLAGLWLVYDFLDESHTISQSIETSSGSYWHGVMHRREGDFSNAKYWFRHAEGHEILKQLADRTAAAATKPLGRAQGNLVSEGRFDPFAFVDACQAAVRSGGEAKILCRRIQQLEWEFLFDHCYRCAVGR